MAEDDGNKVSEEQKIEESNYEERAARVSVIAEPMASKKLAKKLFKLIKKANRQKTYLRGGLRLVQSKIRKGERGLAIFAGNVSPVDVMCHMPAVCEEVHIPYAFVPSGRELAMAMGVSRCTLCVLVRPHDDYKALYDECVEQVKHLPVRS